MITKRATEIYERAKATAQNFKRMDGELLRAIEEIEGGRIYIHYNCRSLFEFCVHHLELPPNVALNLINVMRKSREVPALRQAVVNGLPLTRARRIAPVITRENAEIWIERARDLSKLDFERALAKENPRLVEIEVVQPSAENRCKVEFFVTDDGLARLRKAQDIVSNALGHSATIEETVCFAVEKLLAAEDPELKANRRARRKNASLKSRVLARDGGRCQMKVAGGGKCGSQRFLHFHHKRARFHGGINHIDNMTTLCSTCHRAWHLKYGDVPLYRESDPDSD